MANEESKVDESRKKTGGRKKGTPNKVTADLKSMILGALDDAGGQKYLEEQAEKNPAAFMTLIGKVLPTTLSSDPDAPAAFTLTVIHE